MRKQLVLNIDDVGSTQSANAAMVDAFTTGVATSCSLMVPCAWFADAVSLAKRHGIPMGVHMVISCEYERYGFGPLTREPRLTRDGKGRVFDRSGYQFPAAYADIVHDEIVAQIECALDHGVAPTHLDSHMCTIPRWDDAFAGVCDRLWHRFRIPMRDVRGGAGGGTPPAGMRLPIARMGSFGDPDLAANKRKLRQQLEACVPGLNWVLCHAARMSPELEALAPDAKFASTRENDRRLLVDPEVRAWIAELDLELVGVERALASARSG